MKTKIITSTFLSIFLVTSLVACGKSEETAGSGEKDQLKIGIIHSVTGSAAAFGDQHNKATTLAIEEINNAGGVNGHPIEVHVEDDKSDPKVGIDAAKKLLNNEKVDAIVGSSASLVTLAFTQETEKAKVPVVNGIAGSPKITEQGLKYVWRVNPADQIYNVKAIETLIGKKGMKKIAFIVENSDFGKPPTKSASEKVKELGGEVVAYEEYNRGETDFKAQLSKIKDTKPDVVFTHGYYTEGSIITRQAKELGIEAQLVVNMSSGTPLFRKLAGDAAEGVLFPTSWLPTLTDERSKKFTEAFKAKYNAEPTAVEAGSYESIRTIVEAVKSGGGATPEQIQEGLKKINGFEMLLGKINFNEKNQNDGEVILATFQGGEIKPVE